MDIAGAICLWSAVDGPNVHVGGLIYRWMNVAGTAAPDDGTFMTGLAGGSAASGTPKSIFTSSIGINSKGGFVLVRTAGPSDFAPVAGSVTPPACSAPETTRG